MGPPLLNSLQRPDTVLAQSTSEDQAISTMQLLGAGHQSHTSSSLSLSHSTLSSQLGQAKTDSTQSLNLNHQPLTVTVHQSEPVTIRSRLRSASTAPEQHGKQNSTSELNPPSYVPDVVMAVPATAPPVVPGGVTGFCQIGCGRVLYLNSNVS